MTTKSIDIEHSETSPEHSLEENLPVDDTLNRKYDLRILPWLFLIYLCSFMDRASIGNAAIAGLFTDLKLQGKQYEIALALFFICYMIVDMPAAWIFKFVGPRLFLGLSILSFGICTVGLGFVKTASQLYAVRCLLGLFEGGLTPCLFLYLGLFYRRFDTQRRVAIFYISAPLSGAFGGLLASGLGEISVGNYNHWPWIFFIEGAFTILVSIASLILLPNFPSQCKFLSPEELARAKLRAGDSGDGTDHGLEKEKFSWRKARQGLLDWNTILLSLASIGTYCNVYAYSLFSPSIIKGFGYTTLHSQLLSVPPYIAAVISILITSHFSDRLRMRGPFMLGACGVQAIGWIIGVTAKGTGVRYFALFLCAIGAFSEIPPLTVWLSNNLHPHYARATGLSLSVTMGTIGGIITTFTYNPQTGNYVQLGMTSLSALCAGTLMWINFRENRLRARGGRDERLTDGKIPVHELGSRHPQFKLSL